MRNPHNPAPVLFLDRLQRARGVDVSLDHVAVDAVPHLGTALQIEHMTHLHLAEVRLLQGLVDRRDRVDVPVQVHHREAHPIVGHALVDLQLGGERRLHVQMDVGALLAEPHQFSLRFNDACEHETKLRAAGVNRWSPLSH